MNQHQESDIAPQQPTTVRALLIDLDNCPRQIEQLPETLATFARVIACYGGAEAKMPFCMGSPPCPARHQRPLALIWMQKKSKKGAAFCLGCLAGRLVGPMAPDAR